MRPFVLRPAHLHPVRRNNGRGRRTGQALLLAVLLMVFAAVVGATFITVVAMNMDSTATQEQRQRAASAANAGANVVNYQLNANGTSWRPEFVSPPPAPLDPDYSFYWTAEDIARGYARTTPHPGGWNANSPNYAADWAALEADKANGARVFVKFPDPRLEQNTGSHTYMAEVAVATTTLDGADKAGMLRVTTIGQSSDDPNIFIKRVAYKGTPENGGAFAWNQFLTNWNYEKNKSISATTVGAVAAASNTITVSDVTGFAPGRLITIQHSTTPTTVENAIIQSVNTITKTLTLSSTLVNAYPASSSVRGASTLMNGLIGYEGITTEKTQFNADGYTPATEPGNSSFENTLDQFSSFNYGFKSNSDVQLIGKSNFTFAPITSPQPRFHVAGTILPAPSTGNSLVHAYFSGTPSNLKIPTSFDATYRVGGASLIGDQTKVNDNPFPTQPDDPTSSSRSVKAETPPDLTKFTKLVEMTKYDGQGFAGLGSGVYINNANDVEKVYEGGSPRTIGVSEFQRLVQRKSFPAVAGGNAGPFNATDGSIPTGGQYHRLAHPRLIVRGNATLQDGYNYPLNRALDPYTSAVMSLEQRAYRGWINDHEFVPRGAFIELNGNTITITLDDRSETAGKLPDPSKAWPYATAQGSHNCYRMTIDTSTNTRTFGALPPVTSTEPFNGVIYAEGNVRVRGTNGANDLTIASMGNIYIEGNLRRQSATAGRIALLAKKNVVLNPTQFITRMSGIQDSDVATQQIPISVGASNTGDGSDNAANLLTVSTPSGTEQAFQVGDNIFIQGDPQPHRIVSKQAAPLGIEINPPAAFPPAAGTPIAIQNVAALVASVAGSSITVANAAPFRVGDSIRVGTTNHTVMQVNTTTDTLTLDSAPAAVVDDKVELSTDVEMVRGNSFTGANAVRNTPEWLFRLNGNGLRRMIKLDGTTPTVGNGGSFRIAMRAAGEARKAYQLTLEPTADNGGAVNTPFTTPIPVHLNQDANSDGTITPAEQLLEATDPPANSNTPTYSFNGGAPASYDLQTAGMLNAFVTAFNTAEQYPNPSPPPTNIIKWKLALPTPLPTTGIPFMTAAEAANIPARCLLSLRNATTGVDYWNAMNADDMRQFFLATSASLFWNGTQAGLAIGAPPATGQAADTATMREDFYYTGVAGSEKQQLMRWIERPVSATLTTDTPVRLAQNALGQLPSLRVSTIKLESDDFQAAANRPYTPIPISIDATIFAQEGSWFVIPMPVIHRNEIDNVAGLSASEIATATRMRRLNYAVSVTGNIVQNFTPSALYDYDAEDSPDETEFTAPDPYKGAMAQWISAMSYPFNIENATGTQGRGRDWKTITYSPDQLIGTDLMLPPSPDLSFAS